MQPSLAKPSKKKIKKRRTHHGSSISLLIILGVVGIYILTSMFQLFKKQIKTEQVQLGKIEHKIYSEGVILRKEQSIYSSYEGFLNLQVGDGEKLGKDNVVALISKEQNTDIISNKINTLNEEIHEIQKLRKNVTLVKNDVENIDEEIQIYINEMKKMADNNNFKAVYTYKTKIETAIQKKNIKYESEAFVGGDLTNVVEKKNEYENELNGLSKIVQMPQTGIVSFQTDALEKQFVLNDYSKKDFLKIVKENENTIIKAKDKVQQNDFLFRIVDPYKWYIVVNVNPQSYKIEKLQKVKVRFAEKDFTLNGVIEDIKSLDEKNSQILVAFSEGVHRFINDRKLNVDLIFQDHEGLKVSNNSIVEKNFLKIPKTALIKKENIHGVTIKKDNKKEFIPIYYFDEEEDWIYISSEIDNISIHDEILKDPINSGDAVFVIKDLIPRKGVYVLNSGVVQFKTVNVQISNDLYSIVNPGNYKGIQLYDQIVVNPSTIRDQQKVKR